MNDHIGGNEFADYPKFGYNADGWFAGFNMFVNGTLFNHVDTLAISKADLSGTVNVVPGGAANFTLAPASILDANPGDPEWLVERGTTTTTLKLFQITNVTDPPTQVATVAVPAYSNPPGAKQLGGSATVNTIDDRIMNATMIYGQLLTDHTTGSAGVAHARWYQIDTTQGDPYLYQSGEIDQGPGVYTYFPSIAMNYNGDIGLTFMESSLSEYVSMYVTGQSVNDSGSGQTQAAVDVFPGTSYYTLGRAGDYSGISVDPSDGYTFWAGNEYKGDKQWNTGIAGFGVSPQFSPGVAAHFRHDSVSLGTIFDAAAPTSTVPASTAVAASTAAPATVTSTADSMSLINDATIVPWVAAQNPLVPDSAWSEATGLDGWLWDESVPS
jgi:hypothetical protein